MVFGDAALAALVVAAPKSLAEPHTVSGFGPAKVELYGAAITGICRDPDADAVVLEQAKMRLVAGRASNDADRGAVVLVEDEAPKRAVVPVQEFHRERAGASDPARELDEGQQELDGKLRAWRKMEAEKMGLPQFFVLGTSTLRSIVLLRPRTVGQLQTVGGMDEEKIARFGEAILGVCGS